MRSNELVHLRYGKDPDNNYICILRRSGHTIFEHLGSSERLMSRSKRISGCEMYAIICALNSNDLNTKVDQLYRTVMNRSKFSATCIICSGYSLNKKIRYLK